MTARAMSSGMLSFGLVAVPVKIYPAADSSPPISLHMLHAKCGSKLRQLYVCPVDGESVERKDALRGYEVAKDQHVVLTDAEIEALQPEIEGIEIKEFVDPARIHAVFYEKPYFLGPAKGGEKGYKLVIEAMRRTGLAGIACYASRGQAHTALVQPGPSGRLFLHQLRYASEMRPAEDVPVDDADVERAELELGVKLIRSMKAAALDLTKYRDEQRERAEVLIAQKVAGQEIKAAPRAGIAEVIDLKDALNRSLAAKPERAVTAVRERTPSSKPAPKKKRG